MEVARFVVWLVARVLRRRAALVAENALLRLRRWTVLTWWRWLRRRSQRGLSYDAMMRLLRRYPVPEPRLAIPA
jgi:hypothetical protein